MGSERIDSSGDGTAGTSAGSSDRKADQKGAQGSQDPDVLVREIEETREDLAETIDAIADRVSPQRVKERSMDKLRETTDHAKEVVAEKAATVKQVVQEKAATAKEAVNEKTAAMKSGHGGPEDGSVAVAGSEAPTGTTATSSDLPPTTGVQVPPLSPRPATGAAGTGAHGQGGAASQSPVDKVLAQPPQVLAGAGGAVLALLLLLRRRRRRRRVTITRP